MTLNLRLAYSRASFISKAIRFNTVVPLLNFNLFQSNLKLFSRSFSLGCINYAIGNKTTPNEVQNKKFSEMTDRDWENKLSPDQYYVCREKGTEPPFSGKFYNHFEKGIYSCVCCNSELFSSEHKFQSGCGWPSFHTAHGSVNGDESKSNILRRPDHTHSMVRTEVICKKVNIYTARSESI